MTKKRILASDMIAKWRSDPEFAAAYDALEEEFALASQIIGARAHAGLSQEELAERMNTSQSVIARLESGKTLPSTRTLERLAKATGMRLQIKLTPDTLTERHA